MPRSLILATLGLLLALPGVSALAEEEAGTRCGMHALVDDADAGLLAVYDGLRKGLELAQLPRVCRHEPTKATGGITGFLERQAAAAAARPAGTRAEPIFAVGDDASAAVIAARTSYPCVHAVVRYTAKRVPLVALPTPQRGAVVYADVPVERVGQILRSFLGEGEHEALLPTTGGGENASMDAALAKAMGMAEPGTVVNLDGHVGSGLEPVEDTWVESVLLHLRMDPAHPPIPFLDALATARQRRIPLVTDDRSRFGQGAVVVLVPRHDLVGRASADEARKLRANPKDAPKPRAVPGMEVWVDLGAAEAIGFELPLPFLARADRLRRAPKKRAPKQAAPKKAQR